MQTRKKSVSLAALGIAIPGTNPSRSSHRSPPSAATTSGTSTNNNNHNSEPPAKRLKRSHTLSSAPSTFSAPATPKRHRQTSSVSDRQRPHPFPSSNDTPPQSPRRASEAKLDLEGINDDVVVAVLETLQRTGNRPHLIKELAAVLSHQLKVVESSSNPIAIVSSRLTNYLRRPWTALAPCPLAKEQVNKHPRRVYYYLTTTPRQEIPEYSEQPSPTSVRIISPPASSTQEDDEEVEPAPRPTRDQPSPSPEFELPDLDMNQVPSLSGLTFADTNYTAAHEAVYSTPEEREFEYTVSVMQARKQSEQAEFQHQLQLQQQQQEQRKAQEELRSSEDSTRQQQLSATPSNQDSPSPPELSHSHSSSEEPFPSITADSPTSLPDAPTTNHDDTYTGDGESTNQTATQAGSALFGQRHVGIVHNGSAHASATDLTSSPMLQPISSTGKGDHSSHLDMLYGSPEYYGGTSGMDDMFAPSSSSARGGAGAVSSFDGWGGVGDFQSPENVGLNELDDLLGGFCEG